MCLILLSFQEHADYKLIVAANRDEFYSRPTAPATFWENENLLAGKDLEAGGTWMGITRDGRISMLTNYRDLSSIKDNPPSRGSLVTDYLKSEMDARHYLEQVSERGSEYNGFNIISGNVNELHYYGNYQKGVQQIASGVHGLSNALLNTEWPKVDRGKHQLIQVTSSDFIPESLFELLKDEELAPDEALPNTGVGYKKEKMLSPLFIKSENYGSRCSTVILVDYDNNVRFIERTYNLIDFSHSEVDYRWKI